MEDPYLWLEEVESDHALEWVKSHNQLAVNELTQAPVYQEIYDGLIEIYDSTDKIPDVVEYGDYYYNFWQDKAHVRGIWRRCSPASYATDQPGWETVLDLDALAASEGTSWVWKGANVLDLTSDRAILYLSDGGKDAVVLREFDLSTQQFVPNDFVVPESKTNVSWSDRDTLLIGTASDPAGATDSGYARVARRWVRGTPLADARILFAGETADVSVFAGVTDSASGRRQYIRRSRTFFERDYFILGPDDALTSIPVPETSTISFFHDQLLISLRSDWDVGTAVLPSGALVAIDFDAFMGGSRAFQLLFTPQPRVSLDDYDMTQNHVVLTILDNVNGRISAWNYDSGNWNSFTLETPPIGTIAVRAIDSDHSDEIFLTTTGFLSPSILHRQTVGKQDRAALKQTPTYFDASDLIMSQHEATAPDGTLIPYFQVAPKDLKLDGTNPTLLYGYGGFKVPMKPQYSGSWARGWFARGGVFILANIRGGGEFGPTWHQAALKRKRQVSWNDFIAIGEDLVARRVTSPPHLGIVGGSQGGLLMGVMYTQRPDLWGAVVCQVPLLDMLRYHKLLAGASWMGEYGNPDLPEEREFIAAYSPYQNISPTKTHPRILLVTSTHDDRVHPGHARKMAARLEELGHDFLYWENTEGGHGGAANNAEKAQLFALGYTFLWQELTKERDEHQSLK